MSTSSIQPAPEPASIPFRRVAVVGLGVMGGSLARGLSRLADPPRVVGWSPDGRERDAALSSGAVSDVPESWTEAVRGSDLVVLAAPLEATCAIVADIVPHLAPKAALTDTASLKVPVRDAVRAAGIEARWTGSHPMCGSEASGFDAGREDLYRGARVWTVTGQGAGDEAPRVEAFWRALGAEPRGIAAETHDRLMVLASHLPQLAANGLARVIEDGGLGLEDLGPGGRDMTRLAASNPSMWRDVLRRAPPELAGALRALAAEITELAALVENGDAAALESRLARTRAWRAR